MVKLSITEKKENTLLGRTEVKGTVSFEKATPSNTEVAAALAKELGHSIELVVIKHIHNQFSQREAKFTAFAYKDKQTKTKTEPLTRHLKKKMEEEKKKTEEAKAAENKNPNHPKGRGIFNVSDTPSDDGELIQNNPTTASGGVSETNKKSE